MRKSIIFAFALLALIFSAYAFEGVFLSGSANQVSMGSKSAYMRGAFTAYDMAMQMSRIYSGVVFSSHLPAAVASFNPQVRIAVSKIRSFFPRIILKPKIIRLVPSIYERIEKLSDDSIGADINFMDRYLGKTTLLTVDNKDYTYFISEGKLNTYLKRNAGGEEVQMITDSRTASRILDSRNLEEGFGRFSLAVKKGDIQIITKSILKATFQSLANSVISEIALANEILNVKDVISVGGKEEDIKALDGIVSRLIALIEKKGPCDEIRDEILAARNKIEEIEKNNCAEERKRMEDAKKAFDDANSDAQKLRDRIVNSIDGASYDSSKGYENVLGEKPGGYFRISGDAPLYLRDNKAVSDFNREVEANKDALDAANKKVEQKKKDFDDAKAAYELCMKKAFGDDDSLDAAEEVIDEAEKVLDECDKNTKQGGAVVSSPSETPGGASAVGQPIENNESEVDAQMNETPIVNQSIDCTPPKGEIIPGIVNETEYYKTKNSTPVSQHDGTLLGNWSCGPTSAGSIARDVTNQTRAPGNLSWTEYFRKKMKTNNVTGSSALGTTAGVAAFIRDLNLSYNITLIGDMTYTNGSQIVNKTMYAGNVSVHINYNDQINWTVVNETGFGKNDRVMILIQWAGGGRHAIVLDDVRIRNINGTRLYYISFMDPWTGTVGESEIDEFGCFFIGDEQACITHLIGLLPKNG